MPKNRTIQLRLTKEQYERIKNNCQVKGFNSLSSFLRFKGLEYDFALEQKISQIHSHLLGKEIIKKTKKNGALAQ